MSSSACPLPKADGQVGLNILRQLAATRSPLVALELMQQHVGNLFQIQAPGFHPAVMAGPEYNRHLLLTDRHEYLWRTETDPVTELLRRGVLVLDGEEHDRVRACMEPTMLRRPTLAHVDTMLASTDWVVDQWQDGKAYDMLVEMRKVALLILMGALFSVDFRSDMVRMWGPILRAIDYISPGLWILSHKLPRRRYHKELAELDAYLYGLIGQRRSLADPPDDLLTRLVQSPDMDDDLIRDQLLTMLIAGHDTSTALFAWMLYLLGEHPDAMRRVQEEVATVLDGAAPAPEHLNQLHYVDLVTRETLRLYPPIHIGNRKAVEDVHLRRRHHSRRQPRHVLDLPVAPRPGALGESRRLRPGTLRSPVGHARLHLRTLWRRPAQLHRRHLRPDRGQGRDGAPFPARAPRPAAGPEDSCPHGRDPRATAGSQDDSNQAPMTHEYPMQVSNLRKVYRVPVREAGVGAALRSMVKRETKDIVAVDDISFVVEPGEVVGFLGPNGAGKTTTLKMASGLLHPSGGSVRVLGSEPWRRQKEFLSQITLVMGNRNQLEWDIPCQDSYDLLAAVYRVPDDQYRQTLADLTELLDLGPLLSKPVRNLSLGERMKCEVAGALLHRPQRTLP